MTARNLGGVTMKSDVRSSVGSSGASSIVLSRTGRREGVMTLIVFLLALVAAACSVSPADTTETAMCPVVAAASLVVMHGSDACVSADPAQVDARVHAAVVRAYAAIQSKSSGCRVDRDAADGCRREVSVACLDVGIVDATVDGVAFYGVVHLGACGAVAHDVMFWTRPATSEVPSPISTTPPPSPRWTFDRCEANYEATSDVLQAAVADAYAVATGHAVAGCQLQQDGQVFTVTCEGAPWKAEGQVKGASFVGTVSMVDGCRYEVSATPGTGYLAWNVAPRR